MSKLHDLYDKNKSTNDGTILDVQVGIVDNATAIDPLEERENKEKEDKE